MNAYVARASANACQCRAHSAKRRHCLHLFDVRIGVYGF